MLRGPQRPRQRKSSGEASLNDAEPAACEGDVT
jgi:hypothetical protein